MTGRCWESHQSHLALPHRTTGCAFPRPRPRHVSRRTVNPTAWLNATIHTHLKALPFHQRRNAEFLPPQISILGAHTNFRVRHKHQSMSMSIAHNGRRRIPSTGSVPACFVPPTRRPEGFYAALLRLVPMHSNIASHCPPRRPVTSHKPSSAIPPPLSLVLPSVIEADLT